MGNPKEGKFNVAVGAIIEHKQSGNILLLKRTAKADFAPGIWEEITGRMKQFEELEDALRREIREESGLEEIEIVKPLTVNHFYRNEKKAENELVLIIYWCRTKEDKVILSPEHEDYRWLDPKEALGLTEHPGVKNDLLIFIKEREKR